MSYHLVSLEMLDLQLSSTPKKTISSHKDINSYRNNSSLKNNISSHRNNINHPSK